MTSGSPDATRFGDLPLQCLQRVFTLLSGNDCGQAACVSRGWRRVLGDDVLWRDLLQRDYGLVAPQGPDGGTAQTFREAYAAWQRAWGRYGKVAPRSLAAWRTAEAWTQRHLPAVYGSLRPGATEAELDAAGRELGVTLPPAFRALYRCHDGQELRLDRELDSTRTSMPHKSMLHGILGGYNFYDHKVSVRLMPLERMVRWTKELRTGLATQGASAVHEEHVIFAASFNFGKILLLDTATGGVRAVLSNRQHTMRAVPEDAADAAVMHDGVLRWWEEYVRRLDSGCFHITQLPISDQEPRTPAICLFANALPHALEAVTNGVRVRVSSTFVPEMSRELPPRFFFAYSIRFFLLSEVDQREAGVARPAVSMQLRSRHWRIFDQADDLVDEIPGDGVIGQQPILRAGGEEFAYESCNNQQQRQGAMEGSFTFVPGSISAPSGPSLIAKCPKFTLEVPAFVF